MQEFNRTVPLGGDEKKKLTLTDIDPGQKVTGEWGPKRQVEGP